AVFAGIVVAVLNAAHQQRLAKAQRLAVQCATIRPEFIPGQPLRIFFLATRHRPTFRHTAYDQAQAFAKIGCQTMLFDESLLAGSNIPEVLGLYHWQESLAAFNPHVVIDLNYNFTWHSSNLVQLHPDVFKIIEIFDPIPLVTHGDPVPWRKRDLLYPLTSYYEKQLYATGANPNQVMVRGFSYNEQTFFDQALPRRRKIIFVGNAYINPAQKAPGCEPLIAQLEEIFAAGEAFTPARIEQLARKYSYPEYWIRDHMLGYVVRKGSLHWLCALADEIEIEIYGNQWESDPLVYPFSKGALPHGKQVAQAYNEAEYVLVIHPYDLQSRRLLEVVACGATPVVYDCRAIADRPHWDDHCLWYRSRASLSAALSGLQPPLPPHLICSGRSYTDFARHIVNRVQHWLRAEAS
ncbi:glycosyltransferase family protein, partial [Candidatus Magnetaquicoccus inordinatus]|uniref:glycosyltransferase family protein n=1 Tax=Candidatus Magnetaquicoccus inordinatus TaxID=2496818 RepID=UPI00187D38D2